MARAKKAAGASETVWPADAIVSVEQLSQFLELTPRRIQQLKTMGVIQCDKRGEYDFTPTVQAYIRFLRERSAPDELRDSRADLTKAKAQIAQIKRDQLLGNVIDVKTVEQVWSAILAAVRTRLLAIPSKIASRVKMATTVVEVAQIIREEIHEALDELATARIIGVAPAGTRGDPGEEGLVGAGASAGSDDL